MDRALIERLKKPELAQPLGFYDEYHPELAAIMREAGPDNCLYYQWGIPAWIGTGTFVKTFIYILKPKYEPALEYEDIEIVSISGRLVLKRESPSNAPTISEIIARGNFVCFWMDGYQANMPVTDVATAIREGRKVYARFVKEG